MEQIVCQVRIQLTKSKQEIRKKPAGNSASAYESEKIVTKSFNKRAEGLFKAESICYGTNYKDSFESEDYDWSSRTVNQNITNAQTFEEKEATNPNGVELLSGIQEMTDDAEGKNPWAVFSQHGQGESVDRVLKCITLEDVTKLLQAQNNDPGTYVVKEEPTVKLPEPKPPMLMSRSGRKIKRKRFHDEFETFPETGAFPQVRKAGGKPKHKVQIARSSQSRKTGTNDEDQEIKTEAEAEMEKNKSDTDNDLEQFLDCSPEYIECGSDFDCESEIDAKIAKKTDKSEDTKNSELCALCERSFSSKGNLQKHMKYKHREDGLKCSLCVDLFGTDAELQDHIKEHEKCEQSKKVVVQTKGPRLACAFCKRSFLVDYKWKLNAHMRARHADVTMNCEKCRYICASEVELEQHDKDKHSRMECSVCKETFSNKKKLDLHMDTIHDREKKEKCNVCDEVIKGGRLAMKRHRKTHKQPSLKCQLCDGSFTTRTKMNAHLKETHDIMPLKCSFCDETFLDQRPLEMHLIRNHNQQGKFICGICGKGFPFNYLLKRHEFSHSSDRPFLCTECGKTFRNKCGLDHHRDTHSEKPKYQCPFCTAAFFKRYPLEVHLSRVHKEHLKFPCDKCDNSFQFGYQLRRHKLRHGHGMDRSTGACVCEQCGKSFNTRYYLNVHKKRHRNTECPCVVCGVVVKSNYIKKHMRIHTTVPSVECQLCGKKFFDKHALRRHMVSHTTVRDHICDVCGKGFKTASKLKNHSAVHTGEKRHICNICGVGFTHNGTLWNHRRDVHKVSKEKNLSVPLSQKVEFVEPAVQSADFVEIATDNINLLEPTTENIEFDVPPVENEIVL